MPLRKPGGGYLAQAQPNQEILSFVEFVFPYFKLLPNLSSAKLCNFWNVFKVIRELNGSNTFKTSVQFSCSSKCLKMGGHSLDLEHRTRNMKATEVWRWKTFPQQIHILSPSLSTFSPEKPIEMLQKFRPWCSCWQISPSPPMSADFSHTQRKLAQYKIWINKHILPWVCSTYGIYSTWLAVCEAERSLRSFQKIKVVPLTGCAIISVNHS